MVALFIFAIASAIAASNVASQSLSAFTSCLSQANLANFSFPTTPSFQHLLLFSAQNLRFAAAAPPAALLLPTSVGEVQAAIRCTLRGGFEIRVRSGGHSYEGLSYTTAASAAFVVVDLMNMNKVVVDAASGTAWAEGGATIGEVYAAVAKASPSEYAFPAGLCPTVGVGGHISGGGHGALCRKYGVAADNVADALLVDARGRALDRAAMGEDVFWALRGGGGGSWGVVAEWKLRLVRVPPLVSTFAVVIDGALPDKAAALLVRWQVAAPAAPEQLWVAASLKGKRGGGGGVSLKFTGLYLGGADAAAASMAAAFPDLLLSASDFQQGNWAAAAARLGGVNSIAALADRDYGGGGKRRLFMKAKSDYATAPISVEAWAEVARRLAVNPGGGDIILEPYGGAMAAVASDAIAFPHRAALFVLQYRALWAAAEEEATRVEWVRDLYGSMAPHVSRNPRAAYVNYIDLDLGRGDAAADSWGSAYFLSNLRRLVRAKSIIDPGNVFHHAQSIPAR